MAIKINYGSDAVVLPGAAAEGARGDDLAVLVLICRLAGRVSGRGELIDAIAIKTGRDPSEIGKSVAHWEENGIIGFDGEGDGLDDAVSKAAAMERHVIPERRPQYTGTEAARIISGTAGLADLITEIQLSLGKVITATEVSAIVSLSDYLRLTNEYIMTLVGWCCKKGHASMRYIEKTAYNLYDEGIVSIEALSAHIARSESEKDSEEKLRKLMGIGSRELTKKEKGYLHTWFYDWQLDFSLIERAYEITVDSTRDHKPSYDYMNKVLENWHNAGATDNEAVDALLAKYESDKKAAESGTKSSFNTDEFFELALKRSYAKTGENK